MSDILRLKCTRIDFSAPDPSDGAYSAPQTSELDLRGPTSNGRGGLQGGREEEGVGAVDPVYIFKIFLRITCASKGEGNGRA